MSTSRPLLTQREAAAACGVSRSTIRRRREAGELPGCVEDAHRGWLIPVEALLAAGFRLHAPQAAPADTHAATADRPGPAPAGGDQDAEQLRAELQRLRHEHELELEKARHAQQMAEMEAGYLKRQLHERGEHIDSLQRALAALTPAPERAAIPSPTAPTGTEAPAVPDQATAPAEDAQAPQTRRRWWPGRR